MGRPPRIHFLAAIFHVTTHGVDERELFTDDSERQFFLSVLGEEIKRAGAERLAFCLMDNHVHIGIRVAAKPLTAIMLPLLGRYSTEFNHRHRRRGHLFQARYHAVLCKDDRQLAVMIRYIHMNPVKAGLVAHPRDWRWSSYREYEERELDGLMGSSADVEALAENYDPFKVMREALPPARLVPADDDSRAFDEIVLSVSAGSGVGVEEILSRSRRRETASARDRVIDEAVRRGLRPSIIARALGVSAAAVTYSMKKLKKLKA